MSNNPYGESASLIYGAGFSPVILKTNSKAPLLPDWNKDVPQLPALEHVSDMIRKSKDNNIGVATGTYLRNGDLFAAIDIDTDGFVPFVIKVIGKHVSGKIGASGLTIFARAPKGLKSAKFKAKGKKKYAAELMINSGMVAMPPSNHPNGFEYRHDGRPLHEVAHDDLPLLDENKIAILKAVLTNENAWTIIEGGPDVQGHEPMLALTAGGVAKLTNDLEWLTDCLNALFHPDYSGDTRKETIEMLRSAKDKGLGQVPRVDTEYVPGDVGPLPLGYLEDGTYVFYDQKRRILVTEDAKNIIRDGALMNLAPLSFWLEHYPKITQNGISGFDARAAGDALMQKCRQMGGFDTSKVRGRGVYLDAKGRVFVNWGDKKPDDTKYFYVCHLPLTTLPKDAIALDPHKVLEFFRLFRWQNPSEAYLLLGWTVLAVICGVFDWRPHIFICGRKNTGKTTLIVALMSLLEPIGIALDGQSTEAGIRQKLGADSRPVMLDEFESDQNIHRMKAVIKLIRSASSAKYTVSRGTPSGTALEFCIRSSFLLGAINPFTVTAADRSRIVILGLHKHDNDKAVSNKIAELAASFEDKGPSWCRMAIDNVAYVLAAIKTLQKVFPPNESRHALNMASLLAGAWVVLNQREMTDADAEVLIEEHRDVISSLAEAHEEDDAVESLNTLLGYKTEQGSIGTLLATIKHEGGQESYGRTLDDHGIRWVKDGFIVANSHPGTKKIFSESLWAEGVSVSALTRLDGAEKRKQLRFSGGVRSLAIWIPAKYITEDYIKADPSSKPY